MSKNEGKMSQNEGQIIKETVSNLETMDKFIYKSRKQLDKAIRWYDVPAINDNAVDNLRNYFKKIIYHYYIKKSNTNQEKAREIAKRIFVGDYSLLEDKDNSL